jgi:hypothetical protein
LSYAAGLHVAEQITALEIIQQTFILAVNNLHICKTCSPAALNPRVTNHILINNVQPLKDGAQTASFKDPVRTAL